MNVFDPFVAKVAVSANTSRAVETAAHAIFAANELFVAPIRAQKIAAGGSSEGFDSALTVRITARLGDRDRLRQQEANLKRKVAQV